MQSSSSHGSFSSSFGKSVPRLDTMSKNVQPTATHFNFTLELTTLLISGSTDRLVSKQLIIIIMFTILKLTTSKLTTRITT